MYHPDNPQRMATVTLMCITELMKKHNYQQSLRLLPNTIHIYNLLYIYYKPKKSTVYVHVPDSRVYVKVCCLHHND